MADYNANIRVNADTKGAEREISKLEKTLNKLSDFSLKLNSRDIGRQVGHLSQQLQGIAERGALGGLTLAAGKATAALGGLGAKFGVMGAAAASAGAAINSALGGVPAVVGDILNQVGHIPNAFGLAAVAALAFAPQVTKAAAAATGLGAAIDKAVGPKAVANIAGLTDGIGQLNVELDATKTAFTDLIEGSTLNQLNRALSEAVRQSGKFHSSTQEAVTAAEQLVAVQREQAREQKAINDLVRQAQGLRPQDVENRATNTYRTVQGRKKFEAEQQKLLNDELAEYERLAAEVAAQTKRWAENLDRISRSSRAGTLGNTSQIRTRLEEFRANNRSAEIARQRSAELLAQEAAMRGSNYSLSQVPVRGELLPGGNSMAAQKQYRDMLNEQARIRAAAADALARSESTVLGLQARTLQTESAITAAKRQQQTVDERSIAIAKERNRILMEQFRAEQRNPNYGQPGNPGSTLDRRSLVASLRARKARGEERAAQTENIALGVGFPLLFGGGIGSVAGAGIGSFFGSGFGGQILGGAIGQAIDQFINQITDLGKALLKPTEALNALSEASLITSRSLESSLKRLEEAGFAATANAAAQRDLATAIGPDGARNLIALGDAADRGSRAFAQAVTRFQSEVAGPLGALQARIARGGEISNLQAQGGDIAARLERTGRQRQAQDLRNALNPFGSIGKSQDQVIEQYQAAIKKAQESLPPIPVKLDPKQVREELTNALTKQLESIDVVRGLRNQVVAQQRAQEDADRQRYELISASERTIADLRRSIEDRVTQQRLTNLQRENELLNVQAEIRLQSLRNANIPLRNQFTDSRVNTAANAIADYLEQEQQVQNQIDQQKRDTALDIQRLTIETEQYRVQVATQVARLNEDNAKRIAEINRGIRRANADQDTRRFTLEKQLADLKLKGLQAEFALLSQQAGAFQNPQIQQAAAQGFAALKTQREELTKLQAPGALREVGAAPQFGASTSGLDATNARAVQLLGNIQAARTALLDLVRTGNYELLKNALTKALVQPLREAESEARAVWNGINNLGLGAQSNDAVGRTASLQRLRDELTKLRDLTKDPQIQSLLSGYMTILPDLTVQVEQFQASTQILKDLNSEYVELQDKLEGLQSPTGELTRVQQTRNELLRAGIPLESEYAKTLLQQSSAVDSLRVKVRDMAEKQRASQELFQGITGELVGGISRGIDALTGSTEQLGDAMQNLAVDILKAVGKMLIFYALAEAFGALGGKDGRGVFSNLAKGFGGDPGKLGFRASGGPVTATRPYVVGEGGPELFVPGTNGTIVNADTTEKAMRSALQRYSVGTNTGLAVPTSNAAAPSNATTVQGGVAAIDVRYTVERINSVDYVTADQFQRGMAQAARQGASQGERRALAQLRQNTSARRSVGL